MTRIDVCTTREPDAWMRALESCVPYDFYHLPQYHAIAEEAGEGAAHLFHYTEGDYTLALPLLLRSLEGLPLTQPVGACWRDATSVYGYPGPICSHREIPAAIARNFQAGLRGWLRDLRVVTVFSRLHPFFSPHTLLSGLGECQVTQTVSIDLTLSSAEQRASYRKSNKEAINKLRRLGL
ncbi:MAG TPA: hypothetical protein VEL76_03290, partial [Gemmataceae bacterium]|nr:hypothetical protein [Gemmataceae bacterium]